MRKLLNSAFVIIVVCLATLSHHVIAADQKSEQKEIAQAEINIHEDAQQFQQAGISPFFGSDFTITEGLSKNHWAILVFILSLTLFLFAHKNSFETDIYAFYHTNRDGSVIFGNVEEQKDYEFRFAIAKVFRILGIVTAFTSIIIFTF